MAMVALTEFHFGSGTALSFQSQMGFSLVTFGGFKLPRRLGNPLQQRRCILKISKVNITSTLPTNSVILAEYGHTGGIKRRNALRPKLLKTLQKPKIIIETNDNSKVDAENSEPILGDNSKGEIGDSEAIVNGVEAVTDDNSKLSIVGPEPNINVIRNISDDYLEVVNKVESFRFGNTEVAIMSSEFSANAIEFLTDGNEIHIGSSECNMDEIKMITNPDPQSVTGNDIDQNSAIESQKMGVEIGNSRFIAQAGKMWESWKSWHAQYQKDIRVWGVGQTPIFLVYESANGELKVSVNEDEIRNRFVAQPFLAYRPDEATISFSQSKIAQAKQLAKDIEAGVVKPQRNSTLFEFVNTEKINLEKWGLLGSFYSQASSVIDHPSPVLKTSKIGFVVLISSVLVWGAWKYIFCNDQVGDEEIYKEKYKIANSKTLNAKNAGGISALISQNKRAVSTEAEVRNTALVMNTSNKKFPLDNTEFDKKIQEIQAMARKARMIEQQSSEDFSEQQDGDYPSNSKTIGRNADGISGKEDYPSTLNMMITEAHDYRDREESKLNTQGKNAKLNITKEVNNHLQSTLLFRQAGLKKFSHRNVGNGSSHFREDQNSDTTLKETGKPELDTLQYGQSSTEKAAENERKESVDGRRVKKGLSEKKGFGANRSSLKSSQRIKPRVIKSVNEAREVIARRRDKHGDKSRDTSNPYDKKYSSAESVDTIKGTGTTKEEISYNVRVERASNEKLKLTFRETENESEEQVAITNALESVSPKHLETAQDKAMMDSGNKKGTGLETRLETDIQDGNNALAQEAEELEWMTDEVLRKIVPKVLENEKAGREPMHGLVSEEELLFFRGMERKFEREGESVKIWIKERVENLMNGKGSSDVDDTPKSSTTVWKNSDKTGRSILSDKNNNGKMFTAENMGFDIEENKNFMAERTPVLASSSIASKYSSSAATDATYKSVKSLDRAVSDEKAEDALLSPERKLGNYEIKKAKIFKEHEMDDCKATTSKGNECQRELQNHFWWMNHPYVLCIGLYRNNKGEVLRGLYSLEMVPGIESASKPGPYHTIAFQDHADARNFCYILQSHHEELGDASVHVIPLSSKEFYDEAMSTALRVTVIKKGELRLHIGQPIEEVESRIIKIGSAIYSEKNIGNQPPDIDSFDGFGNRAFSPS